MKVENISARVVVTSTGRVYQTAGVVFFRPFSDFRSLELSPCFVERYPYADARIRIQVVDNFFPFFAIVSF